MSCLHVIQRGSRGPVVSRWQSYLLGQGCYPHAVDGDFGCLTEEGTKAFQYAQHLCPDGRVGDRTFGTAMVHDFEVIGTQAPGPSAQLGPQCEPESDSEWPRRPGGTDPPSDTWRRKVFGHIEFQREPLPGNPENIVITNGWARENIVRVTVPQLIGVPGASRGGRIHVHRKIQNRVAGLFRAWEHAQLLGRILTWNGSYVSRLVRGSRTRLSNHAYGTAFDINAAWNPIGAQPPYVGEPGSVRDLAPIAADHGFFWGGWYRVRRDGMHFEACEI